MNTAHVFRAVLTVLVSVALPEIGLGQGEAPRRAPDVHFVPTDTAVVREMLSAARVTSKDLVYDLGCGDGRIVIRAVKQYRARGVCVDIDPARIAESRKNARKAGVAGRITFHEGDLFKLDLRQASVVTLYLLPALNERLRPKLFRELRPGSRVVSNAFDMGEWKADSVLRIGASAQFPAYAYLWIMPAAVAGSWSVTTTEKEETEGSRQYEIRLEQRYQEVEGTVLMDGRTVALNDVSLEGDRISFALRDALLGGGTLLRFDGRVSGDSASGTVTGGSAGKPARWTGVRTKRGAQPEVEAAADAGS